ncbi:MAG: excinuclease ABC subunit UvrA, partial [Spirochaetota bacterium]
MDKRTISITGARTHNLKNISLDIPKNSVVVFTGLSGSGKSSLVFDTIHTEAQRQLVETFSSFARRRLPKLSRPDVEEIRNIGTSIVIDQKRLGRTMRSTVGTAAEISTYLRMLFSRCGDTPGAELYPSFYFSFNHPEGMCRDCSGLGKRIQVDTDCLIDRSKSLKDGAVTHPDFKVGGWNWRELIASGLFPVETPLSEWNDDDMSRLLYAQSIPVQRAHAAGTYLKYYEGLCVKLERLYVNKAEDELPQARKTAYDLYFRYSDCGSCGGSRLNTRARSVTIGGRTITDLSAMELTDLDAFLLQRCGSLPAADPLVRKMHRILSHLIDIGVGYLSLSRAVATLSGGESQRLKMARQLDCDLVDLMYILDEPTTGLHPRDG